MSRKMGLVLFSGAAIGLTAMTATAQNLDTERAYGSELVADAEGRTSLLQAGGTAGFGDGGFFIGSGDGNNTLNIGVLQQFRYTYNGNSGVDAVAETTPPSGIGRAEGDDSSVGFTNNITQFDFTGNIINPDLNYHIQFELQSGSATLTDAYATYTLDNGVTIGWGQVRVPLMHEFYRVQDGGQLGASRGPSTSYLDVDRTQGVWAHYRQDQWEGFAVISDGANGDNTGVGMSPADFSITVRGNYLFSGDWDRFNDATSFRGSEDAFYVGGVFHYQTGGETEGTADTDVLVYGADAAYESDGWNASAAFYGFNVDPDEGDEQDLFAVYAQGGYFITDQWEGFGRWDYLGLDSDGLEEDSINFLTFGANYYFIPESHAAKFTADIVIALNEIAGVDGSTSFESGAAEQWSHVGLSESSDSGSFALRGQMQIEF
ncbi:MAG: hypothetical protein AAGG07_08405 [Planctomycetota bacterium]